MNELERQIQLNSFLPNLAARSHINVADFYAYKGWIFRLTGNTGGAQKISLVTPSYTTIARIPVSNILFDGSVSMICYEAGSAATSGSTATPLNANRTVTTTSLMTCKTGVTYANDGTIFQRVNATNFKSPTLNLWYLKPSTQYIITFDGSTNYEIQWAEVPI